MSDTSQGDGWWIASDGKWYPPEQHPDHVTPPPTQEPQQPPQPAPEWAAETVTMPAATGHAPQAGPAILPAANVAGAAGRTLETPAIADPVFDTGAGGGSPSRNKLLLGLGALVLVAGLGFLAVRVFGGGSGTGADSPQAAVEQLLASIDEKDAVGFVEIFDPDEIDAWFGSFTPAFGAFDDLDDDADDRNELTEAYARIFDAIDYTITGPGGRPIDYEVDELDPRGRIARVRIDGLDITLNTGITPGTALIGAFGSDPTGVDFGVVDGVQMQIRDERGGLAARLTRPGFPAEDEFAENTHLDVVTVQKDGKWYVSVGYSMLEIARSQPDAFTGFAQPDFGRAYELVSSRAGGADSPEAVVRDFLTAFETLDYDAMIRLSDPLATPYLHDYQPLIDEQVDDRERRDAAADLRLSIDEIDLGVSEWEGRTLVTFANVAGRVGGGTFDFDARTLCATAMIDGERGSGCLEDLIAEGLAELDNRDNPRDYLPDEIGLVVVERNGRWYLDSLGTFGFYSHQVSDAVARLVSGFETDPLGRFGEFFVVEGPIARRDAPVIQPAEGGTAGVALDLAGFPTIGTGFDERHVALARVLTTEPGSFVSYDLAPLRGVDWIVAYDAIGDDDTEYPAIGVYTDGDVDVELLEVTITEVGIGGYTGQLGGEGRPQILTFTDEARDHDIVIDGVNSDSVWPWDRNGTVLPRDRAFGSSVGGDFTVIFGEPGASFEVRVVSEPDIAEDPIEPDDDPFEPDDEPIAPTFDDPRVAEFAAFVNLEGYEYVFEQSGGYFDGCGPDDPDVTSYGFEPFSGERIIFTPYPSVDRARSAHDALLELESPCEFFEDLEVISAERIATDNIRIEYRFPGDPVSFFEQYRLVDETILVATATSLPELEAQLSLLDGW